MGPGAAPGYEVPGAVVLALENGDITTPCSGLGGYVQPG